MIASNLIQLLKGTLPKSTLPWVVSALRQDALIWNTLNQPDWLNRLACQSQSLTRPEDWIPAQLVQFAIQEPADGKSQIKPEKSIVKHNRLNEALKALETPHVACPPLDFETAGLIAYMFAERSRLDGSWNYLITALHSRPDFTWGPILACLYGMTNDPIGLLSGFIQPGTDPLILKDGLHALFSNPIHPDQQLDVLHQLIDSPKPSGKFNSLDILSLLQLIADQRPELASRLSALRLTEQHLPPISSLLPSSNTLGLLHGFIDILLTAEHHRLAGDEQQALSLQDKLQTTLKVLQESVILPDSANPTNDQGSVSGIGSNYDASQDLSSTRQISAEATRLIQIELEDQPNNPRLMQSLAEFFIREKKYSEAAEIMQIAAVIYPIRQDLRRRLAEIHELLGAWEQALEERESLMADFPPQDRFSQLSDLHSQANCAIKANQPQRVVDICQQAITLEPEDGLAYCLMGEASLVLGNQIQAMEQFSRATQLTPTLPRAWLNLADLQLENRLTEQALETLQTASQAIPDQPDILLALGEFHLGENAPSLAVPILEKAMNLDADHPLVALRLGQALTRLGHYEQARQLLERSYQNSPGDTAIARAYIEVLISLGDYQAAISPLEMIVGSAEGEDSRLLIEYVKAILAVNKASHDTNAQTAKPRLQKALTTLERVIDINPEDFEARALMADIHYAMGNLSAAFQAYQQALQTPLIEDQHWHEHLSTGFGMVSLALGKSEIAIAALQEALQVNPLNTELHKQLSDAFITASLPNDALRTARAALNLNVDDLDTLTWFSAKIIQLTNSKENPVSTDTPEQMFAEAQNALVRAIQIAPDRIDLLNRLGRLQLHKGDRDEARNTFRQVANSFGSLSSDLKEAANYLLELDDASGAITCLQKAVELEQKENGYPSTTLLTSLIQAYLRNQDLDSAIAELDKALSFTPDDNNLHRLKAVVLMRQNKPETALTFLEAAIQGLPVESCHVELYFLASAIHRASGNITSALKYAEQGYALYLQFAPGNPSLIIPGLSYITHLADLYRSILQFEQALQLVRKDTHRIELTDENRDATLSMLCLQAELACQMGDVALFNAVLAEMTSTGLLDAHHQYPRLFLVNAQAAVKTRDIKTAEQHLSSARQASANIGLVSTDDHWLPANSGHLEIKANLEVMVGMDKWDEAVKSAEELAALHPNEPFSHWSVARVLVMRAEHHQLCELADVIAHAPGAIALSEKTRASFQRAIQQTQSKLLELANAEQNFEITVNDQSLRRLEARGALVFGNPAGDKDAMGLAVNLLIRQQLSITISLSTEECAAVIMALRRILAVSPDTAPLTTIFQIARAHPQEPSILIQLALALGDEHFQDALSAIQAAVKIIGTSYCPYRPIANAILAKLAYRAGNFQLAEQAIGTALEDWPNEPRWHALAARLCQANSAAVTAIDHLVEAAKHEPKRISHHLALGKAYMEQANVHPEFNQRAIRTLEKACYLAPQDLEVWMALAQAQSQAGEHENAVKCADHALSLAPQNAPALRLRSEIAYRARNFPQALEYAQEAVQQQSDDPEIVLQVARSLQAIGQHSEALNSLESVVEMTETNLPVHMERVALIHQMRGAGEALEALRSIQEKYPEDLGVHITTAQTLAEYGDVENAIQSSLQALKQFGKTASSAKQADLHLLIGRLSRRAGQLDQAIHHLSEATQIAPELLDAHLELGLARRDRREFQQAISVFQHAAALSPHDPRPVYQAGLTLKDGKDYKQSEAMLRRAASLAPHDVNIRRTLAAVIALNIVHNPKSVAMKGE